MTNSVDPDQLASEEADLDLHCLQRQGISRLSRTRVNRINLFQCSAASNLGLHYLLRLLLLDAMYISWKHKILTPTHPLKPHLYIVKLGFTGVYIIILLISAQKHRLWYSLELPQWGSSNEYPQCMFLSRNMKNIRIFIWKLSVFGGEIFSIFE